jgi:hypothetical protein
MRRLVLAATGVLALAGTALADPLTLTPIGTYATGIYDDGGTEIATYDPQTMRVFSVNGSTGTIEVIDLSDPTSPVFLFAIDLSPWGRAANSVDVHGGVLAAAVEASPKQDPGRIVFFETSGACNHLNDVPAGALPDMITFSPDGARVLTANEGEPDDSYTNDPEGSVTIVDLSAGVAAATATQVGFGAYNGQAAALKAAGVRIFGPGATVAQDLEPEYIAMSPDGLTAWVTCQEANALAVIDVASATVTSIVPLGTKDHSLPGNGLDPSNQDGGIRIANWPLQGFYLPDAIAAYSVGGQTYLVTANEGDTRSYDGFDEEARFSTRSLDPIVFPDAAVLKQNANLGRLLTSTANGDIDGDGDLDVLHSLGGRSFSIRDAAGNLVFDSGDEFEQIIAALQPSYFNGTNTSNTGFDSRSDDKGPEPEGVALAEIDGRWYALIGLERQGGVMLYDVTDPMAPLFLEYTSTRVWTGSPSGGTAGGLGPEGIKFISAAESPVGQALVLVSNEVSGTIDVMLFDTMTVGIEEPIEEPDTEPASLPARTALTGIFPNPFNPMTNISFSVAKRTQARLDIVDLRGRLVETLFDGTREPGEYRLSWSATSAPAGVYLAVLRTDSLTQVRRLTLVK